MDRIAKKLWLGWGKIRRAMRIIYNRELVREMLQRRTGGCNRTGACCKLMVTCPAFDDSDGPACLSYEMRPEACIVFPMDEMDLRDRDIVEPDHPCGYSFLPKSGPESREWKEKEYKFSWERAGEDPPSLWDGLKAIWEISRDHGKKDNVRISHEVTDEEGPVRFHPDPETGMVFIPIEAIEARSDEVPPEPDGDDGHGDDTESGDPAERQTTAVGS